MQSNGKMYTALSENDCWVRYSRMRDKWVFSNGFSDMADMIAVDPDTLSSQLSSTASGLWPVQLGGKLFQAISMPSISGERTVLVSQVEPSELMAAMESTVGSGMLALSTSTGNVLALSGSASERFPQRKKLSAMFDSTSSAAIEAALLKCSVEGAVGDFLVSSPNGNGDRINYSMKMRTIPTHGKLVLSGFSIPSVAVVSGTIDSNSISRVLLEESFCPNAIIDRDGVIVSMNVAAKELCRRYWGYEPIGALVYDLVDQDQREAVKLRHEQRVNGNAVPSRYSVKLHLPDSPEGSRIDISIVPLNNLDRWVVFLRPVEEALSFRREASESAAGPGRILQAGRSTPEDVLSLLIEALGADSAVWIHGMTLVTAGDCTELLDGLDRSGLAARGSGFLNDSTLVQRVDSGYGLAHLLVQGLNAEEFGQAGRQIVDAASRVLEVMQLKRALEEEKRTLALMRDIAAAFLKRTESLEGLLGDFTRACGAETAAVFRITGNGRILHGLAGAGLVGDLPDLPLDVLNTASWACLRGETALYTSTPESDLRFARVFPESMTELAVPFFSGTTPEGAILIASTGKERFSPSAAELAGLLALLFTVPEETAFQRESAGDSARSHPLRETAAELVTHILSSSRWTVNTRVKLLEPLLQEREDAEENFFELLDSVNRLGFYSKWTLWFLRVSLYGGKPDQKWLDPVPLLERTLREIEDFRRTREFSVEFIPPDSDLEVCTDGSFVGMIAASLLMCILENCESSVRVVMTVSEKGDNWVFSLECVGSSIPGECLSTSERADSRNVAFMLAWKLTEELGGTVSTFSSRGKSTRMVIRLRKSG